jgi:hypothetical protein
MKRKRDEENDEKIKNNNLNNNLNNKNKEKINDEQKKNNNVNNNINNNNINNNNNLNSKIIEKNSTNIPKENFFDNEIIKFIISIDLSTFNQEKYKVEKIPLLFKNSKEYFSIFSSHIFREIEGNILSCLQKDEFEENEFKVTQFFKKEDLILKFSPHNKRFHNNNSNDLINFDVVKITRFTNNQENDFKKNSYLGVVVLVSEKIEYKKLFKDKIKSYDIKLLFKQNENLASHDILQKVWKIKKLTNVSNFIRSYRSLKFITFLNPKIYKTLIVGEKNVILNEKFKYFDEYQYSVEKINDYINKNYISKNFSDYLNKNFNNEQITAILNGSFKKNGFLTIPGLKKFLKK